MPNNDLKKRGNMALAEVDIDGLPEEYIAHSKINSSMDTDSTVGDFSYQKTETDRIFTTYEPAVSSLGKTPFDRYHDTEVKILGDIASNISDTSISGTIDLYTELPACQSCTNVIFEFRRMFPNIELNVFTR